MPVGSLESTYTDIVTSVFSTPIAFKAWFATAAAILAIVQVLTGARIFGKLQRFVPVAPPKVNRIHRWSGRLAVLATIPVAFHCIFILGFQTTDARVFAHSLLGSFVYGVLAVKLWYVHDRDHLHRGSVRVLERSCQVALDRRCDGVDETFILERRERLDEHDVPRHHDADDLRARQARA